MIMYYKMYESVLIAESEGIGILVGCAFVVCICAWVLISK